MLTEEVSRMVGDVQVRSDARISPTNFEYIRLPKNHSKQQLIGYSSYYVTSVSESCSMLKCAFGIKLV